MTILTHIQSLIRLIRAQAQVRRSLGAVLLRDDDHLLGDIGLTRHTAARLIRDPLTGTDPFGHQVRMSATFTPAAATGAGSFRWATSGSPRPM